MTPARPTAPNQLTSPLKLPKCLLQLNPPPFPFIDRVEKKGNVLAGCIAHSSPTTLPHSLIIPIYHILISLYSWLHSKIVIKIDEVELF